MPGDGLARRAARPKLGGNNMAQIDVPPAQARKRKPVALFVVIGAGVVAVSAVLAISLLRGEESHTIEYHGRWNVSGGSCSIAPLANLTVKDGSGQIVG